MRKLRVALPQTVSFLGSEVNPMEFVQDHIIVAYNDVKKDVTKLLIDLCERHQFAFVFLKDFENDIYFVI